MMSALPPKADIVRYGGNVCFVPQADILRCGRDRRYSIISSARAVIRPRITHSSARTIDTVARSSVSRWILESCAIPSPNRLPPFRDMR
jgi:hypothetical protein